MLDKELHKTILTSQRNEITEHHIYKKLSKSIKDTQIKKILKQISKDELDHYYFWKKYAREDVEPDKLKIWKYVFISRIFGITFGIKLMERGEEQAQVTYGEITKSVSAARSIVEDEEEHEKQLIDAIDEERLRYIGSMVRGLNDAIVELTGALAGFALALQSPRLIAMIGLITGIAASLSRSASEYLATKSEESGLDPAKASFYTGSAYFLTALFLIYPFLLFTNIYFSLSLTVLGAMVVIFTFTFYISVARDIPFKNRFFEMALISLGIAALSFCIGFLVRAYLGMEI